MATVKKRFRLRGSRYTSGESVRNGLRAPKRASSPRRARGSTFGLSAARIAAGRSSASAITAGRPAVLTDIGSGLRLTVRIVAAIADLRVRRDQYVVRKVDLHRLPLVDADRGDDRGILRHDVLQDPVEVLGAAAQDDRTRGVDVPVPLGGPGQTVEDAEKDRGAELQEPVPLDLGNHAQGAGLVERLQGPLARRQVYRRAVRQDDPVEADEEAVSAFVVDHLGDADDAGAGRKHDVAGAAVENVLGEMADYRGRLRIGDDAVHEHRLQHLPLVQRDRRVLRVDDQSYLFRGCL